MNKIFISTGSIQGRKKDFFKGGGGSFQIGLALISSPTLYIGNVSNLPPKRRGGGGGESDPQFPTLLKYPKSYSEFLHRKPSNKVNSLLFFHQKNPGAIRHPEDDKGIETHTLDMGVDVDRAHVLSPFIGSNCHDAHDMSYMKEADLRVLSRSKYRKTPNSSCTQTSGSAKEHLSRKVPNLNRTFCFSSSTNLTYFTISFCCNFI